MKAIWTGSIGFGLVNIPIKLFSAVESSKLDFDMLDKKDQSNIKFKRVNESTGKEVLWENIIKGYLLNDKYVLLDDKDFAKASPEKTSHVEIIQFVKEAEIDSVYFESPYFIKPEKSGARAYQLLKEALEKTGKAGVGSFVMREREHVCVIKPYQDILVLNRLRYAEEVRNPSELKTSAAKPKPAEVKMAISLIDQLTEPFDPAAFKDMYSDKLLKIIKAKSKGKALPYKPMKIVHSKSTDLMDQLKASLGTKKKKAS
ncbi:MAG: Ku protein [Chitinophagaceae bacterium]|nr:MAG: Ku protein [Chitinophagaceae bacterium]